MKPETWTSIEEWAREGLGTDEIPVRWRSSLDLFEDPISRREFIQAMGASIALAGISGCTWMPPEGIIPYVVAPEEIVPGKPRFYASSHLLGGFARGILVETHEGRPTKIEGNPQHPASLGRTDIYMQASILSLYDPKRGRAVTHQGLPASWDSFVMKVTSLSRQWNARRGEGLRLLTPTITSPTLLSQIKSLLERYPRAVWHRHEPVNRDPLLEGARLAFGQRLAPLYHLDRARVIVTLDSELLAGIPGSLNYSRDFSNRRRVRAGSAPMNRLYSAESAPTLSGAMADHRLPIQSSRIGILLLELIRGLEALPESRITAIPRFELTDAETDWIRIVIADLKANAGSCLITAGEIQPAPVHALVWLLNSRMGNIGPGKTLSFIPPPEMESVEAASDLPALVSAMQAGKVDTLVMLSTNPAYNAPADLPFLEALSKVPNRITHDLYPSETSFYSDWYLPATHPLESWGDARTYDGTASLLQPTIAPLYGGRSTVDVLSILQGSPGALDRDVVQAYWRTVSEERPDFEEFWYRSLREGLIEGTAPSPESPELSETADTLVQRHLSELIPKQLERKSLELCFRPDPTIFDGTYSENAWLQELPKPLLQLCWDNAALISPATAVRLNLKTEDVVRIALQGAATGTAPGAVEAPVFVLPGHADDSVTVTFGYGKAIGPLSVGRGFNAFRLMRSQISKSEYPGFALGISLQGTGQRFPLANAQQHWRMETRDPVHVVTFSPLREAPSPRVPEHHPSLLPELLPAPPPSEQWAMVIDLNVCIGCKACTIACQAENNIPTVGKNEVMNSREMHWIRVDRYFQGEPENPGILFQPVPCMHCEKAPCELVCPTEATSHDYSGLNQMVYNRCVGTRYCSNNCPYKVRRFNFFQYADMKTSALKLMRNPDVTVRSRGVMEKCTYCIQRIHAARIEARLEDRPIRDGEVITACAAACPTEAIIFGNLGDPKSRVAALRHEPYHYALLDELGTQPRTTYLAKLLNPAPVLEPEPTPERTKEANGAPS